MSFVKVSIGSCSPAAPSSFAPTPGLAKAAGSSQHLRESFIPPEPSSLSAPAPHFALAQPVQRHPLHRHLANLLPVYLQRLKDRPSSLQMLEIEDPIQLFKCIWTCIQASFSRKSLRKTGRAKLLLTAMCPVIVQWRWMHTDEHQDVEQLREKMNISQTQAAVIITSQ